MFFGYGYHPLLAFLMILCHVSDSFEFEHCWGVIGVNMVTGCWYG